MWMLKLGWDMLVKLLIWKNACSFTKLVFHFAKKKKKKLVLFPIWVFGGLNPGEQIRKTHILPHCIKVSYHCLALQNKAITNRWGLLGVGPVGGGAPPYKFRAVRTWAASDLTTHAHARTTWSAVLSRDLRNGTVLLAQAPCACHASEACTVSVCTCATAGEGQPWWRVAGRVLACGAKDTWLARLWRKAWGQ
jgi:hypothetical protein